MSVSLDDAEKICADMKEKNISAEIIGIVKSREDYTVKVAHRV